MAAAPPRYESEEPDPGVREDAERFLILVFSCSISHDTVGVLIAICGKLLPFIQRLNVGRLMESASAI
jgi:hypothetical protein